MAFYKKIFQEEQKLVGLNFGLLLLPFLDSKIAENYKMERFLQVFESDEKGRLSNAEAISSDWRAVGMDMKKIIKG